MIFLILTAFGCQPELTPDGTWDVTVTGLSTDCVDDSQGFQESYMFNIFFEGSKAELRIEDEVYATGDLRGCHFDYQSAIFLEDAEDGPFRWVITGSATIQTTPGLCDMPEDGYDWYGYETLRVLESEHPDVETDCEYDMEVRGTVISGG